MYEHIVRIYIHSPILYTGLDNLLDANRVNDLTLLYKLLQRTKAGLSELCQYFSAFIKVSLTAQFSMYYTV